MINAVRLVLVFGILLVAMLARPLQAQTNDVDPVIVQVVTKPLEDHLQVTVVFALRDAHGRPVLNDGDKGVKLETAATVKLLVPGGPDAPAIVSAPKLPLNLLLLFDTSGSMAKNISTSGGEPRIVLDDVKTAAIDALDAAPAGTRFALARFDDMAFDAPLNIAQPLTSDRSQIAGSIKAIPNPRPNAATCMFNAAYQAVEYLRLNVSEPSERRAVLLFTDGKDETVSGTPCSTRRSDDVVIHAQGTKTALYTIGLCNDKQCSNLDDFVLKDLAQKTTAVPVTGMIDELGDRFTLIMKELSSQWALQADLYPHQGHNTGLIEVMANGQTYSKGFTFESERDYNPPPTFALVPTYDSEHDRYVVEVKITDPHNLEQATLEIWDTVGGTIVVSQTIGGPGRLEVSTKGMIAKREYMLGVRAVAKGGQPLLGPEKSLYVTEKKIIYDPQSNFTITATEADWENKRLLINVEVTGAGGTTPIFNGQVTNERGEELIPIKNAALNKAGRLELALSERMWQAQGEQKLKVRLSLASVSPPVEHEEPFSVQSPSQFPWLWLLVGAIVALVGVYSLLRLTKRPVLAGNTVAPLPPTPLIHSAPSGDIKVAVGAPRLRIRVVHSPDASEVRSEVITKFPCVIGAGNKADFLVRGASTVSRTHLQVTHDPRSGFELTDISRHGTFVISGTHSKRLSQQERFVFQGPVQVSLAQEITLDLEPL